MLITKVELYEQVIDEVDGEFQITEKNRKIVPAMLTNYAIEHGHRSGLLRSSLIGDVLDLFGSFVDNGGDINQKEETEIPTGMVRDLKNIIDDSKLTAVIYLGCIGANRKFEYSYEEFLEVYHADIEEKLKTYMSLISGLSKNDKHKFAKEFKNATQSSKKK